MRADLLIPFEPEVWRPCPTYPLVECSSHGQLRRAENGRIIKQSARKESKHRQAKTDNYMLANVPLEIPRPNGLYATRVKVHVLICTAFHGPRPPKSDAHHKDDNKQNNNVSNLEWKDKRTHNSYHASQRAEARKRRSRQLTFA